MFDRAESLGWRPLQKFAYPEDLPAIESKMREIIAAKAPFTCETWPRDKARAHFEAVGETYKLALLDAIPDGDPVTVYRQDGWLDLCRGPHMRHTGDAGGAFKLTHVAGAYWRGNSNNKMLSRIYGVAFANPRAPCTGCCPCAASRRTTLTFIAPPGN